MTTSDWVRVHIPTIGQDVTMTRAQAKRRGSSVEPLRSAAVDVNGRPLPPKPRHRPEQVTDPRPSGKASETQPTSKEKP